LYAAGGAAAISVLTEPAQFDGALADLVAVASAVEVPAMRKDFLVDPYQLFEARAAGAGGALLILRILDDARLGAMLDAAAEAGLFVLLEAFDVHDLVRAAAALARERAGRPPVLVGVNTRDLATLEVNAGRLAALRSHVPAGVPAVAESGLSTPEEAAAAARVGYRVALVGGALMRSPDPCTRVRDLIAAGRDALAAREVVR
jgi:indole-3-glycerol phosphate synthase